MENRDFQIQVTVIENGQVIKNEIYEISVSKNYEGHYDALDQRSEDMAIGYTHFQAAMACVAQQVVEE